MSDSLERWPGKHYPDISLKRAAPRWSGQEHPDAQPHEQHKLEDSHFNRQSGPNLLIRTAWQLGDHSGAGKVWPKQSICMSWTFCLLLWSQCHQMCSFGWVWGKQPEVTMGPQQQAHLTRFNDLFIGILFSCQQRMERLIWQQAVLHSSRSWERNSSGLFNPAGSIKLCKKGGSHKIPSLISRSKHLSQQTSPIDLPPLDAHYLNTTNSTFKSDVSIYCKLQTKW